MKNLNEKYYVLGCGWVSSKGYGVFGNCPDFNNKSKKLHLPSLEDLVSDIPVRYGRFDDYTKVCFLTASLALKDGNFRRKTNKSNVGVIVGSQTGVYNNDISFYKTTLENKAVFTSPNLFSYTLPNIAIGEIAVHFGFTGPSFSVGNGCKNPGMEALRCGLSILAGDLCNTMLIGWVEVVKLNDYPFGAAFVFISKEKGEEIKKEFYPEKVINFYDLFGV